MPSEQTPTPRTEAMTMDRATKTHRDSWLDGWEAARSAVGHDARAEAEEAWRLAFGDSLGALPPEQARAALKELLVAVEDGIQDEDGTHEAIALIETALSALPEAVPDAH